MITIGVQSKSGNIIKVATFLGDRISLMRSGKDGVYSEIKKLPAKNLKDALNQVGRIYGNAKAPAKAIAIVG